MLGNKFILSLLCFFGCIHTVSSSTTGTCNQIFKQEDTCDSNESCFGFVFMTDRNPEETTWKIVDTFTNEIKYEGGPLPKQYFLWKHTRCIDLNSCYKFTFLDSFKDGLDTFTSIQVFLDEELVLDGGEMFGKEYSILFGNNCTSSSPSTSVIPTSSPSTQPSSYPSSTHQPSSIASNVPTFLPIESVNVIGEDTYGRRYFPNFLNDNTEASPYIYPLVPNCGSQRQFPGCIKTKRATVKQFFPKWSGSLYPKPPRWNETSNTHTLGIPMSQKLVDESLLPVEEIRFDEVPAPQSKNQNNFFAATTCAVAADINGDGFEDIILGFYAHSNQLYLNNGNGTFSEQIYLPGGESTTHSIAVADVDNDGMIDILVGNTNQEKNYVIINPGRGMDFLNAKLIELPGGATNTRAIAAGDINNDGMIDIVIGNYNQKDQLLLNRDGNFPTVSKNLTQEELRTSSVVIADVNNDGRVDIICGYDTSFQRNKILKNEGELEFSIMELPTGAKQTTSIAVADMDGDGSVDIIIGNAFQSSQLLLNDGSGVFANAIDLPGIASSITQTIDVGDFNNNGLIDIVLGNYGQENIMLLNKGHGNGFSDEITLPGVEDSSTMAFALADFNRDRMTDLFVGNNEHMNMLLHNTEVSSELSFTVDLFNKDDNIETLTSSIAIADLNNDGTMDIIFANRSGMNRIFFNDGTPDGFKLAHATDLPGRVLQSFCAAVTDINNDGLIDIIIGNANAENQLYINQGNATFTVIELPGGTNQTLAIAAADINNDNMMDIIVGNFNDGNYLLVNSGNGTSFDVHELPGDKNAKTTSVALADVDGNGMVDIVVGNDKEWKNLLLLNNGQTIFTTAVDLPDSARHTRCIAIADLNNDDFVDIIVGNRYGENQIYMNDGNANFSQHFDVNETAQTYSVTVFDVDLDGWDDIVFGNRDADDNLFLNDFGKFSIPQKLNSGEKFYSRSVASGDLNNDGAIDVVFGRYHGQNQIIYHTQCNARGASIHTKSWCFRCPSYMGKQSSFCVECLPDMVQDPGESEKCSFNCADRLQKRNLHEDQCLDCPEGHRFDKNISRINSDPTTWSHSRCNQCSPGHYVPANIASVEKCFECKPGTYQNEFGSSSCKNCALGEFQPNFSSSNCNQCPVGGYCNSTFGTTVDGGYTKCPPGTFNNETGKHEISACKNCRTGSYNPNYGGNSSDACIECPSGTYSNITGSAKCILCDEGTFQNENGQMECKACHDGSYADNKGFRKCIECPHRLSNVASDVWNCSICDEGFYLKDYTATPEEIFKNPFDHCKPCPPNAECPRNTSLLTLQIHQNYWRHSVKTSKIYACEKNAACKGIFTDVSRKISSNRQSDDAISKILCIDGHKGPLCQVCEDANQYYNSLEHKCTTCPSLLILILQFVGIFFAVIILIASFIILVRKSSGVYGFISSLGLQAKIKMFISFYQVLRTFDEVYGVQLSTKLKGLFSVLVQIFSVDFLDLLPMDCFGSTSTRFLLNVTWPYIMILTGVVFGSLLCLMLQTMMQRGCYTILNRSNHLQPSMFTSFRKWMIQGSIFIIYFSLPLVATRIFNILRCRPFQTSDNPITLVSYLIMDMSVECDPTDSVYFNLLILFWLFFVLWNLLTPLGIYLMLRNVRTSIQSNRISEAASACRYLWQDYIPSMWYWDVVDIMRKIFLTGLIMFVDRKEGSNRIVRLVLAILVSVIYLSFLLAVHPYKRSDDYAFAMIVNLLLIFCFVLGVMLKLCDDDSNIDSNTGNCNRYIGFDSFNTSVLVVTLALGLTIFSICFIIMFSLKKMTAPTVKVLSTGYQPNLELPEGCNYHIFMSHVWSSGQAKTHAIVRKLQLHLPGLKIWLDVDELEDISRLEESVDDSAVFVIYYSRSYFQSRNCRREVNTAINKNKPIMLLYEETGQDSTIEEMKKDCIANCSRNEIPAQTILEKILEKEGILWLDEAVYSAAALNRIYSGVLNCLPHYQINNHELVKGISVPNELGAVSLDAPITVLINHNTVGTFDVAMELEEVLPQSHSDLIAFADATTVFSDCSDNVEDDISNSLTQRKKYFLLYLNRYTFENAPDDNENGWVELIEKCLVEKIEIILVFERDEEKGGCEFETFFSEAPAKLIQSPICLFDKIAISLHKQSEYRRVGLRQILKRLGTVSNNQNGSFTNAIENFRRSVRHVKSFERLRMSLRSRG